MSIFWYQVYQARLWECFVTMRGLMSDSTCVLKAVPGKLDIKKKQTWYFIYQFTHCFTRQTSNYDVIFYFCVNSVSLAMSFKKCNVIMTWWRHMPWDRHFYQATCNNAVNMTGNCQKMIQDKVVSYLFKYSDIFTKLNRFRKVSTSQPEYLIG